MHIARNHISFVTSCVVSFESLAPWIIVFFVFIMPAKRKSLCPGFKTPKQNHVFAAPEQALPGRQLRTRFLTMNYQKAGSSRHARTNQFLRLWPQVGRKSNLNCTRFLSPCGICYCSWKASQKSRRQWKNECMKPPPGTPPKYSLPTESFDGSSCTCLTYKCASMQPHVRMLKCALTSWI